MVTAGIYMICRSNLLFALAPFTLHIILIVGIATSLFAAIIGIKQNDIKKILAYSTVSQLGLMFAAIGLGAFESSMFHVMTHAFFKALLFLGAGSVIHAMGGEQDIRKMGGLNKSIKLTFVTFLIATLAISGIFPFAGFFSKDEILAKAFEHNLLVWALLSISSMITAF
jgi:NADH-quinone oxidoreductase subunit L